MATAMVVAAMVVLLLLPKNVDAEKYNGFQLHIFSKKINGDLYINEFISHTSSCF